MVRDMELGLKRSDTLTFKMMYKMFIVMGGVDLGLRPSPLTPIIQVCLVYHWFLIVMVMREVYIGIIPDKFLHISLVYCTFPTQGFLKNLFQGVWKEKLTSKSSLLFLSKHVTIHSSKHATSFLSKHSVTPNFSVSILHYYSYVCTFCSSTLPSYTILSLFT